MKCPLSQMTSYPELRETRHRWADCIQAECAWWDQTYERCDPTGLAHTLVLLHGTFSDILTKMPQDERTRRKA